MRELPVLSSADTCAGSTKRRRMEGAGWNLGEETEERCRHYLGDVDRLVRAEERPPGGTQAWTHSVWVGDVALDRASDGRFATRMRLRRKSLGLWVIELNCPVRVVSEAIGVKSALWELFKLDRKTPLSRGTGFGQGPLWMKCRPPADSSLGP